MKVYEKLQKCRVELQRTALKKSGNNKFAGYQYFELGDFLPRINELMQENKLSSYINFTSELSTLTIVDTEDGSKIEFTSPMAEASLKGCHSIQNLGAIQTYLRRYLYMNAFEIVEHDAIDSSPQKEVEYITDKQARELLKLIEQKGQDLNYITTHYKVKDLTEFTEEQYIKLKDWLEKKTDKVA